MENVFNSSVPRDHLVLPDRQATKDCNLDIDEAVGNYIVAHKPAVIVDLGDHADMPSLSKYDVGKLTFEGRRYSEDIDWSIAANKAQWKPFEDYNRDQRKKKEKLYKPFKVMILGNHDNRINKAVQDDPKYFGHLSIDDLQYDNWFDVVAPFLQKVVIDGVTYVHYSFKKIPDRATGGEMAARNILKHEMVSITVGHTPELQYYQMYNGQHQLIQCLVAGCRFDHYEPYAGERNKQYWRGIIHKRNVHNGNYNLETIDLKTLLKEYL